MLYTITVVILYNSAESWRVLESAVIAIKKQQLNRYHFITFPFFKIHFLLMLSFSICLPVQLNPSPVYPGRQVHMKLPTLLLQMALALQLSFFVAHSSISVSHAVHYYCRYFLQQCYAAGRSRIGFQEVQL